MSDDIDPVPADVDARAEAFLNEHGYEPGSSRREYAKEFYLNVGWGLGTKRFERNTVKPVTGQSPLWEHRSASPSSASPESQ